MEEAFKLVVGLTGATVTLLFGEWGGVLTALVILIALDYMSGIAAAASEGKLSSKVGYKGVPKKVAILVMVAAAHMADLALGKGSFFRDATVFFYIANELLSVIENAGRLGLPVPGVIQQAVEVLKKKGDGTK